MPRVMQEQFREVPQASTGFSPFELLYARPVRGPLDIPKANWEALPRPPDNVLSHVLGMRERLQDMGEMAQANQEATKASQKRWYDALCSNTFLRGRGAGVGSPTDIP